MEFVAIVERSLTDWHVDIPALAIGGPVPEPYDVQAFAVALVAAATGLPAAGVEVSLYSTVRGHDLLPTRPTEVEGRHNDGFWRTAEHTGWLRQRDGSWRALVSYAADGAVWRRAVHVSSFRQPDVEVPAVPAPRASVESVHLARLGGG